MEIEEIYQKIKRAFKEFVKRDYYLLQNNTSEQSMAHRLAIYIEVEFPDYDVDCEFNRNGLDERPKLLQVMKDQSGKTGRIYPDIIVHKRGKEIGMVAIETRKPGQKSKRDLVFDRLKLKGYLDELSYKHAFYITFPVHKKLDEISAENYIEKIL